MTSGSVRPRAHFGGSGRWFHQSQVAHEFGLRAAYLGAGVLRGIALVVALPILVEMRTAAARGRMTRMPHSDPAANTLDVPGARLYYEQRGSGPLLLMIGSPMDSTGFAGLATALAGEYTVVTYDPRGIGHSSREDAAADVTPEQQADDVCRLLSALGGGPAYCFGSSGGGVVGLALVTAHPDKIRTLVAHEPPVIELLPDREQLRAQIDDVYQTFRTHGADKAMQKFMVHAGLGDAPGQQGAAPRWEPTAEQVARMRASTELFLAHLIRPTTNFRPDIDALRATPARIVVGAGSTSKGQLPNRTAVALADRLGTAVTDFPGDHGGFVAQPELFGRVLDEVLHDPS